MEETPRAPENQARGFIPDLGKLPWFLKIPLFLVALFLIAMPYILIQQKNPFNQAVATYDALCRYKQANDMVGVAGLLAPQWSGTRQEIRARLTKLQCVPRRDGYKLFIREDGTNEFTLLIKGHGQAVMVRFMLNDGRMKWLPK